MENLQLVHSQPVYLETPNKAEPQKSSEKNLMESADNININLEEVLPNEIRYPEIILSRGQEINIIELLNIQEQQENKTASNNKETTHNKFTFARPSSLVNLNQYEKKLRSFKSASQVKLDTIYATTARNKDRKQYCQTLTRCKPLTNLSLNLSETNAKMLNQLVSSIRGLNLSTLTLDIDSRFNVTKAKIVALCIKNLSHSLKTLNIHITSPMTPLRDQELAVLSSGIRHLACLSSLTIRLSDCFHAADSGVRALALSLSKLDTLSVLVLDLNSCCAARNTSIHDLFVSLGRLTQLKTFSLTMDNCYLSLKEMNDLSCSIAQMQLLKTLSLSITRYRGDTMNGVANILSRIYTLRGLSALRLAFTKTKFSNNQLLESIASHLKTCNLLSALDLDFGQCPGIHNSGIVSLSSGFSNHYTSLSHLALRFNGCLNVNDADASRLAGEISKMEQLSSLTVDFENCRNVSSKGMDSLYLGLKGKSSLKAIKPSSGESEVKRFLYVTPSSIAQSDEGPQKYNYVMFRMNKLERPKRVAEGDQRN